MVRVACEVRLSTWTSSWQRSICYPTVTCGVPGLSAAGVADARPTHPECAVAAHGSQRAMHWRLASSMFGHGSSRCMACGSFIAKSKPFSLRCMGHSFKFFNCGGWGSSIQLRALLGLSRACMASFVCSRHVDGVVLFVQLCIFILLICRHSTFVLLGAVRSWSLSLCTCMSLQYQFKQSNVAYRMLSHTCMQLLSSSVVCVVQGVCVRVVVVAIMMVCIVEMLHVFKMLYVHHVLLQDGCGCHVDVQIVVVMVFIVNVVKMVVGMVGNVVLKVHGDDVWLAVLSLLGQDV